MYSSGGHKQNSKQLVFGALSAGCINNMQLFGIHLLYEVYKVVGYSILYVTAISISVLAYCYIFFHSMLSHFKYSMLAC